MGKVKTQPQYQKVADVVDHFNGFKRDKLWQNKKEQWQASFRLQLLILKTYIDHEASDSMMQSFMYRLALGYFGLQCQSGIPSGIFSAATVGLPSHQTTGDHIFGAVEIGRTVKDAFEKSEYNMEYMLNEWLFENLYLWMTVKVSKEEHKSSNIIKNKNSIEEKRKMMHYKSVSELMAKFS